MNILRCTLSVLFEDELSLVHIVLVLTASTVFASLALVLRHDGLSAVACRSFLSLTLFSCFVNESRGTTCPDRLSVVAVRCETQHLAQFTTLSHCAGRILLCAHTQRNFEAPVPF